MNKRTLFRAAGALLLSLLVGTASAQALKEGVDYTLVKSPQASQAEPGKIEVLEFFSLGCPHCAHLAPQVHAWEAKLAADVQFTRVPVAWNAPFKQLAGLYHTLVALGEMPRLELPVFKAIHEQNQQLFTEAQMGDWYAKNGGDKAKFSAMFKSFGVAGKVNQGHQRAQAFGVDGVPKFVVDGRFVVENGPNTLATVDKLIDKVRAEKKKK